MQHNIVIVGGGTSGITVAAQLLKYRPDLDIAIIEPSEKHYYQPMWTLVGGGMFDRSQSERNEEDFIPKGATWIRDFVDSFDPSEKTIVLRSGEKVRYNHLVVAAGIQLNWDQVKGLKEAVGHDGVCSNYSFQTVAQTWEYIRDFKSGTALFTQPSGAVKCGGAPQKICYLADDHFRKAGVRENVNVMFTIAAAKIFAVDRYARELEKVIAKKGIDVRYQHELVEIRGESKEAVYLRLDNEQEVVIKYDMAHVTPPMGPPNFIRNSPLSDKDGWVHVDSKTLQHKTYPEIFGIGDASNLPTSKTAAAIRKQAPVLVANLLSAIDDQPLEAVYDGYTSCPLVTGYDSLILAEFDYDKKPQETFPVDQSIPRFSMLLLKKYGLPNLYWHGMLRGRV